VPVADHVGISGRMMLSDHAATSNHWRIWRNTPRRSLTRCRGARASCADAFVRFHKAGQTKTTSRAREGLYAPDLCNEKAPRFQGCFFGTKFSTRTKANFESVADVQS
jgi:hypothetical protein